MRPRVLAAAFFRVDFDRELVYQFFISFSLFENALKESGYYHVGSDGGAISPDWRKFAASIDDQFTVVRSLPGRPVLTHAVEYLLTHPPKKQVLQDGHIRLVTAGRTDNSDTVELSILINRVRNNLFHGEKFTYDRGRDTRLLQSSLDILEAWAELDPNIASSLRKIQ